jgi:hypothetical protein
MEDRRGKQPLIGSIGFRLYQGARFAPLFYAFAAEAGPYIR